MEIPEFTAVRALSSEVDPDSRKENASKQEAGVRFRFNRNRTPGLGLPLTGACGMIARNRKSGRRSPGEARKENSKNRSNKGRFFQDESTAHWPVRIAAGAIGHRRACRRKAAAENRRHPR